MKTSFGDLEYGKAQSNNSVHLILGNLNLTSLSS